MKKRLQVLLFLSASLACSNLQANDDLFKVSSQCLYSGDGKSFRNLSCKIERLEVSPIYFSDKLTINKASFIVSAGNVTPSYTGEENATFSGNGIPEETVKYFWLNRQFRKTTDEADWICFQRGNLETFCEPSYDKLFELERSTTANPSIVQVYGAGTYKVGVDIPAGEYKVYATSRDGTGTVFVSKTSNYRDISNMVHHEIFNNHTYVTVSEGQYLRVNFGKFELVK
ncbi:hypothetical protein X808_9200 [Mannheimia varigena USDA-ARS-USMARC-1296]|uniref:Uncharacterized protein n=1 Tax=Mannheimia varigena USDA-ARS-USMARC-1296 TaxID=1433287 RepID=W0QDY9_9PAST|nr:hypothetical protein [Mannheimia varigena]AHG75443.1 hypothetical protein X808_9200 [Mannheimia varigena USDA-ARS-USMARC-1296]